MHEECSKQQNSIKIIQFQPTIMITTTQRNLKQSYHQKSISINLPVIDSAQAEHRKKSKLQQILEQIENHLPETKFDTKQTQNNIQMAMARMIENLSKQIQRKQQEICTLENDGKDHKDFHLYVEMYEHLKAKRKNLKNILKSVNEKQKMETSLNEIKNIQTLQKLKSLETIQQTISDNNVEEAIRKRNINLKDFKSKVQIKINSQLNKLGLFKEGYKQQSPTMTSCTRSYNGSIHQTANHLISPRSTRPLTKMKSQISQMPQVTFMNRLQSRFSIIENQMQNVKIL